MHPIPNRVGSSDVNIKSSMARFGRSPLVLIARSASSPPITPTVPSYIPANGIASVCEPVPTAGNSGCEPSSRIKIFPTASSRTFSPASFARPFSHARISISRSLKTTRVTATSSGFAGSCSQSVMRLSVFSSSISRAASIAIALPTSTDILALHFQPAHHRSIKRNASHAKQLRCARHREG